MEIDKQELVGFLVDMTTALDRAAAGELKPDQAEFIRAMVMDNARHWGVFPEALNEMAARVGLAEEDLTKAALELAGVSAVN